MAGEWDVPYLGRDKSCNTNCKTLPVPNVGKKMCNWIQYLFYRLVPTVMYTKQEIHLVFLTFLDCRTEGHLFADSAARADRGKLYEYVGHGQSLQH